MTIATGVSAQGVSTTKVTHQQYRVVVLPVDGGTDSSLAGYSTFAALNNWGTIGVSADTSNPAVNNSYTSTAGVQTDLQPLPPLPDWSGNNTYVNWINQWGLSAGYATRTNSITGASADSAVVWTPNGEVIDIQQKNASQGRAVWVNNFGQVAGWFSSSTPDSCSFGYGANFAQTEGFIWQFGFLQRLGTLGGAESYGEFINDRGQVSGHSQTSNTPDSVTGCPPFDPFVWENGRMIDINPGNFGGAVGGTNFLNNRGQAVGYGTTAGEVSADPFLWQNGVLTNLNTIGTLGGQGSAFNVNERGHVIGINSTADGAIHVVLWREREFIDLSTLSGYDCSYPGRINNRDQIVGYSFSCETGAAHAFLWENGEMLDLNTLIPDDADIELQYAEWINEEGLIAVQGVLTTGTHMGDTRAVLLIPNGPCDPGVQAVRAAALNGTAAARQSAATDGPVRGASLRGPDGRVNPMFLKPVPPAVLRSAISKSVQSNAVKMGRGSTGNRAPRLAVEWVHQREPEVLAENARHVPGSGRRADPDPCWSRKSGGANCESQTAGPRGRDQVGIQLHSMTEVEIESL
jgi:probable HAF family extracellular repeat protein